METKIGAKSMVLNEKTAVDHKENIFLMLAACFYITNINWQRL